ncbi:MAG: DUF6176 family protein [Acidobacteria bacterium]|nr:DUF6176 family protein [Acidobacteriota bacterium]
MKVELSRFRIKQNKSARVDEWLKMLNDNMGEVLQTLDREQMRFEVIFREMIDGEEFLYWFSVQDESGQSVETSPFEVDRRHLEFHDECIDASYGMRDAQPQVVMIPSSVAEAMHWRSPEKSVVEYQRRELIYGQKPNS